MFTLLHTAAHTELKFVFEQVEPIRFITGTLLLTLCTYYGPYTSLYVCACKQIYVQDYITCCSPYFIKYVHVSPLLLSIILIFTIQFSLKIRI